MNSKWRRRPTYWEQRPTMTLATGERSEIHFLRPDGDRRISSYSSSKEVRRLSTHLSDFSRTIPWIMFIIAISSLPRNDRGISSFSNPTRSVLGHWTLRHVPASRYLAWCARTQILRLQGNESSAPIPSERREATGYSRLMRYWLRSPLRPLATRSHGGRTLSWPRQSSPCVP